MTTKQQVNKNRKTRNLNQFCYITINTQSPSLENKHR